MKKENRFELRYISKKDDRIKVVHCTSEEDKARKLARCEELGLKVVSVKKLYPFSTAKNQHNFALVSNVCFNKMYDMINSNSKMDGDEYDRLDDLKELAERFFALPLPIAWLTYDEWQRANKIATLAVEHRIAACIENGHEDLIQYC